MLSAGFSNVTYLKSRLLPEAMTEDDAYDIDIAALGKSVAGKFGDHCNRDFARAEGAVDEFNARGTCWTVRRYPVEEIASVAVVDPDGSSAAMDADLWSLHKKAGLLQSLTIAGSGHQRVEITYTGGYWLDPRDGTAMPAGATALPDAVLEAWVTQCQHEAESRGLFHARSVRKQKDQVEPRTATLEMLPGVERVLAPYRRFASE